jgi:hypothetical protein
MIIDPKALLDLIASDLGFDDALQLLEHNITDSVVPGICTDADCLATNTDCTPDAHNTWCAVCDGNTVVSCLELMMAAELELVA